MSDVSVSNALINSNTLPEFLVQADEGSSLPLFRDDENQLLGIFEQPLFEVLCEFSPIVLQGPSGVGKSTNALKLIRDLCCQDNISTDDVLMVSGADYCRSYALAVETNSVSEWRSRFDPARIVMIDGLQQMAGKTAAQNELRSLIDQAELRQKMLVFTCLDAVDVLERFDLSTISRLVGGLSIPLRNPSPTTRVEYLSQTLQLLGFAIESNAVQKLADTFALAYPALKSVAAELTQSLKSDYKKSFTPKRLIDLKRVNEFLKNRTEARPDLKTISSLVAKYFGIRLTDMKSQSRKQAIVHARSITIYLARTLSNLSLENIGRFLGKRDHTTVLHAFKKIEKLLESDQQLRTSISELKMKLSN